MIFNRLTGLDLGKPPSYLIADNIKRRITRALSISLECAKAGQNAMASFADNGNDLLGLSRNLGEVYGVFGVFEPKKEWWHLLGYNYSTTTQPIRWTRHARGLGEADRAPNGRGRLMKRWLKKEGNL